jgi:hypothetical protein
MGLSRIALAGKSRGIHITKYLNGVVSFLPLLARMFLPYSRFGLSPPDFWSTFIVNESAACISDRLGQRNRRF